jgi:osmotically-inducible protein OsmY
MRPLGRAVAISQPLRRFTTFRQEVVASETTYHVSCAGGWGGDGGVRSSKLGSFRGYPPRAPALYDLGNGQHRPITEIRSNSMSQDSLLQLAVLAELAWEPSVTAGHIGVTANAGIVTLTGHVETYAEKHAAETAARRVKGVKAVAEELEVLLPFERKRGDDDIAAAVLERLAWDVTIPPNAITVKVEQGWIALTGQVNWYYQKEAAEQDVRRLTGVVGVSNLILVKPAVDAADISTHITQALHRSWLVDTNEIKVTAEGGAVRLSGAAYSPQDRDVAFATAWAAPGVVSVENDILVL